VGSKAVWVKSLPGDSAVNDPRWTVPLFTDWFTEGTTGRPEHSQVCAEMAHSSQRIGICIGWVTKFTATLHEWETWRHGGAAGLPSPTSRLGAADGPMDAIFTRLIINPTTPRRRW